MRRSPIVAIVITITITLFYTSAYSQWTRHIIGQGRGPDGTKLLDVNADGLKDISIGCEEGDSSAIFFNPGYSNIKNPWQMIYVGRAPSVEDAVFTDLNSDGNYDVVSSCEGTTKRVLVHWAPTNKADYKNPAKWTTAEFTAIHGMFQCMYAASMQIDGLNGTDLIIGTKSETDPDHNEMGWLEAPADPKNTAGYVWHKLTQCGWIMEMITVDMDGDGDKDILISDRTGIQKGVRWLENPNTLAAKYNPWVIHWVGGQTETHMFFKYADLDKDGKLDIVSPVYGAKKIAFFKRMDASGNAWTRYTINLPANASIDPKSVGVADFNGDGRNDIVFAEEHATGKNGCQWLQYATSPTETNWIAHDIGGTDAEKHDRIEVLDLDGDGDQDVMTCEERTLNAAFWYENPRLNPKYVKGINLGGTSGCQVNIAAGTWLGNTYTSGCTITGTTTTTSNCTENTRITGTISERKMGNSYLLANSTWGVNQTIANGTYNVYLWVFEHSAANSRNATLKLEGVSKGNFGLQPLYGWKKYGPYNTTVSDGVLNMQFVKVTGSPKVNGILIEKATLAKQAAEQSAMELSPKIVGTTKSPFITMSAGTIRVFSDTDRILSIVNMNGQTLLSKHIGADETFLLPQSTLTQGVYTLRMIDTENRTSFSTKLTLIGR